jgi:hypothetical protein
VSAVEWWQALGVDQTFEIVVFNGYLPLRIVAVLVIAWLFLRNLNRPAPEMLPPLNRIPYRRTRRPRSEPLPYLQRQSLLSRGETAFFHVLNRAVRHRFGISIKTRLADIVQCPEDLWETTHGRRLCQKHIDFILYDWQSLAVVAVIELDDASHDLPDRRLRDRFVNRVFRSVDVPLIRVRAAARYSTSMLRERLATVITDLSNPVQ